MGSPYLLARGLGRPVANARAQVEFPETAAYRLWVRCKDWVPSHHPGRFEVVINGDAVAEIFGAKGPDWFWQEGGKVEVSERKTTIELKDLTGFDRRCDALFFTTDESVRPPNKPDEEMGAWRRKLLGLRETPPSAGKFDVVVVGGGVAGCSAALASARLGLKSALVQDRPVLGGNASSEINIPPQGLDRSVVNEVAGSERSKVIKAEKNIKLFLGWRAFRHQKGGGRITSVDAKNIYTNKELSFNASVFIDCTGDGWVGYWAGADYRMGREARSEFNERLAPEKADKMTHGSTLFFGTQLSDKPVLFPDAPWATEVPKDHIDIRSNHSWEYGHLLDMINDAESIRDHLFRAVYGAFSTVKRRFPKAAAKLELTRVDYIAARGESKRLMGDHILTENDIRARRPFPDAVATGSLVFCLHYPGKKHDL